MPSPPPPLTEKQRLALRAIVDHIERHDVAPSVVELSAEMGLNHKMASYSFLNSLESKGYLRRVVGVSRSIVLLRNEDGTPIERADEAA
jgi:SOS-response transcriptional repressor LexA